MDSFWKAFGSGSKGEGADQRDNVLYEATICNLLRFSFFLASGYNYLNSQHVKLPWLEGYVPTSRARDLQGKVNTFSFPLKSIYSPDLFYLD